MPGRDRQVVVCAALRAPDGDLLLGIRHYDAGMWQQIQNRVDGEKFHRCTADRQGFVDNRGGWLSRADAYRVAEAAGQIRYPDECRQLSGEMHLFSEGLY